MKQQGLLKIGVILLSLCILVGCGANKKKEESMTVKIGTMSIREPIVQWLGEELEKEGYKVEPVLYDGNHLPATALSEGSVDGVILNHKPWMETFNRENETNLIMVEPYIYYGVNALWSAKYDKIEDIPSEAKIAVPGDPTNLDRSLRLLQAADFITLKDKPNGDFYNLLDIKENKKNIEIIETEINATIRSIDDVDALVAYASDIKNANLDHKKYLFEDPANKDFPSGLIVREEDKDHEWVKKASEAFKSESFREKFNRYYDETLIMWEE